MAETVSETPVVAGHFTEEAVRASVRAVEELRTRTVLELVQRIDERLARLETLIDEFRPVIDQFRSPVAAYGAARKARRNGR